MNKEQEVLPLDELTAFSPLDGRYWPQVRDLAPYAGELALIRARFEVESVHMIELSREGVVRPLSGQEVTLLENLGPSLTLDQARIVKRIEDTTDHDVKAAELAAQQFLATTSLSDITRSWHLLVTSSDIDNFAYRLLARRGTDRVMVPVLADLTDHLVERARQYKRVPMLGRTHGQGAVGTTVGKEIVDFADRLNGQVIKLERHELTGKINGAVGNYNAFMEVAPNVDWIAYSKRFAERLGFKPQLITTQINPYEDFIELFQIYQRINGILLDLDQDAWRYISDHYFVLKADEKTAGSSTMAQKINPIRFENSAGNLKIARGFFNTFVSDLPVSRLQRDLEDSTVIRNVGTALGHSLLAYRNTLRGFQRVSINPQAMWDDLEADYGILSEAVQQHMRLKDPQIEDPYTLVKLFVRGRKISEQEWIAWVKSDLSKIVSDETRLKLLNLKPRNYLGLAEQLTDLGIQLIQESRAK